jgi:hypothetical protein
MIETKVFYKKEDWYRWYLHYTEDSKIKVICYGNEPTSFPCFAIIDHDPHHVLKTLPTGERLFVSEGKEWKCTFIYKARWVTEGGILEVWDIEKNGNRNLVEEHDADEDLVREYCDAFGWCRNAFSSNNPTISILREAMKNRVVRE